MGERDGRTRVCRTIARPPANRRGHATNEVRPRRMHSRVTLRTATVLHMEVLPRQRLDRLVHRTGRSRDRDTNPPLRARHEIRVERRRRGQAQSPMSSRRRRQTCTTDIQRTQRTPSSIRDSGAAMSRHALQTRNRQGRNHGLPRIRRLHQHQRLLPGQRQKRSARGRSCIRRLARASSAHRGTTPRHLRPCLLGGRPQTIRMQHQHTLDGRVAIQAHSRLRTHPPVASAAMRRTTHPPPLLGVLRTKTPVVHHLVHRYRQVTNSTAQSTHPRPRLHLHPTPQAVPIA